MLYAASIFKLQSLARSYRDLNLKILFKDGDALITRARASLVSQFLDDRDATHLLFVDADIGFEPEQVLRLIECGADICAAVYPIKRIDWDKVEIDYRSREAQSGGGGDEIRLRSRRSERRGRASRISSKYVMPEPAFS